MRWDAGRNVSPRVGGALRPLTLSIPETPITVERRASYEPARIRLALPEGQSPDERYR